MKNGPDAQQKIARPIEPLPEAPALPEAASDDQLFAIWLHGHGRSVHTQRAYRADIARFRRGAGKPLPFTYHVVRVTGEARAT